MFPPLSIKFSNWPLRAQLELASRRTRGPMARRLTTNQEIAGSIPAAFTLRLSFCAGDVLGGLLGSSKRLKWSEGFFGFKYVCHTTATYQTNISHYTQPVNKTYHASKNPATPNHFAKQKEGLERGVWFWCKSRHLSPSQTCSNSTHFKSKSHVRVKHHQLLRSALLFRFIKVP